jgi:exo-1,4-beta-D-glucosaminidase
MVLQVYFVPNQTDLAITFVDWAPAPPDASMGIWREVTVDTYTCAVAARFPSVFSNISADLSSAELQISVDVTNLAVSSAHGNVTVFVEMDGSEPFSVSVEVALAANETRTLTFASLDHPTLHVRSPLVWWPWQMGAQPMHNLSVWFSVAADATACHADVLHSRFAIRQVSSELDKNNHRLFRVNGRPLLIRGGGMLRSAFALDHCTAPPAVAHYKCRPVLRLRAFGRMPGYTPDLFLREDLPRLRTELTHMRFVGLNALRLEGKFGSDELFEIADELGSAPHHVARSDCAAIPRWAQRRRARGCGVPYRHRGLLCEMQCW